MFYGIPPIFFGDFTDWRMIFRYCLFFKVLKRAMPLHRLFFWWLFLIVLISLIWAISFQVKL